MCPISFNIYRMNLIDRYFYFQSVIVHFWDKPFQEMNFKSDSKIVYYFVNTEKYYQICTCSIWLYFTLLACAHFCNEIQRCHSWKLMKYFTILRQMKNIRFEYVPWKNLSFCFIAIAWVYFSHKTEKFWFWKPLKYLNVF